ncbi:hypothetical protein [Thalassotalea sp. ND16A]|uniref:hypothetical protein n=1 Tax=Thalassotalea sp. ND16A TaxID=1535422 RepID=UPI00051A299F|nr:hypothetical protein [Thalassotalea sp. ND16A]KGJ89310.1 hypothetical protein ND16A_2203 [Thalassotalea sp. ND16A]
MKQNIFMTQSFNSCPQSFSILFEPNSVTLSALDIGPGYRILELDDDGNIETQLHYLDVGC